MYNHVYQPLLIPVLATQWQCGLLCYWELAHQAVYYLHVQMLDGTHLSDRYFLHCFFSGIHSTLQPLARYLETKLAAFNSPESIQLPAPDSLSPENLILTLQQYCSNKGRRDWCSQTPNALNTTRDGTHCPR